MIAPRLRQPLPGWRAESRNRSLMDLLRRPQRPRNAREWAQIRERFAMQLPQQVSA